MELSIRHLSNYLTETYSRPIVDNDLVLEAFRKQDVQKAIQLISSFLAKRHIYTIPAIKQGNVGGEECFFVYTFTESGNACVFCWSRDESASIKYLMFSDNEKGASNALFNETPFNWTTCLELKGANVVRCLQLVSDVMSGRVSMDKAEMNKIIRDAQIWESVEGEYEEYNDMLTEANDPVIDKLKREKGNLYQKIRAWQRKGKDVTELQRQYDELATQLSDARVAVRSNVPLAPTPDKTTKRLEDLFADQERALPEEKFEDMQHYIIQVIKGIRPLALLCGAPGLGKTFRVMQTVNKEGMVKGRDYEIIKGKCTAAKLYMTLHDYQEEGQLLIVDDADEIIRDETAINLLKAATDSSKERWVSYGIANAPIAPEEKLGLYDDFEPDSKGAMRYPSSFLFKGSMIIITNYRAGQIDTAIRSRAIMCDLDFTMDEIVALIEGIAPHIKPEILTPDCKERALEFLRWLVKEEYEFKLNIRAFIACAEQYLSSAPERVIKRRIIEQLVNQTASGGKKY